MVKALIALSSYNDKFYPDGKKTGVYFVEAYHPWKVFTDNNIDVTFVSETGTFGWDENSLSEQALGDAVDVYNDKNSAFLKAVSKVEKAADVKSDGYQILFAAGGHGTLFDFPKAKELHRLAYEVYSHENVLAAVCHGPALFDNLNDAFGQRLIVNKKITGFTDEGESTLGIDSLLKLNNLNTIKEIAELSGAEYVQPPDMWGSFAVVDGNLVTGVNPASATETAQKSLQALEKVWKQSAAA